MRLKLSLAAVMAIPLLAAVQTSDQVDRYKLKEMLAQLGYDVKDLDSTPGKEKYTFNLERAGLNIPVAAEISANGNFIWLTVFCKQGVPAPDRAVRLLRKNADVQPTQFYVTKSDKTMAALSIENRGVTNALLRQRAEKIVEDVANSKEDWQD